MESLSFESTIESPTKPHQEKVPDKNNKLNKSLFLVQVISDTKISSQNLEIKENHKNNEIKESSHNILNFDDILSIVFPPEEKAKKIDKKNSGKKLLENKRKRQAKSSNINKSKNIIIIKYMIIIDINKRSENNSDKMKENNSINNSNNKNNNRKMTEDIYNINNFYSSTVKIREKSLYQNVVVPNYEELDDDFFEDNGIEVRILYIFI